MKERSVKIDARYPEIPKVIVHFAIAALET